MSRIQNVLDKAEREGALRRTRAVSDPARDNVPPAGRSRSGAGTSDAHEIAAAAALDTAGTVIGKTALDALLVAGRDPASVGAEQYRALRTRLLHREKGAADQVLLVTSPSRGDGRSLMAANLGLTMAQDNQRRICVVDADLRSPQQRRLFGLGERPGLSDVLVKRAALEEAFVTIESHQIVVLPAGTPAANPAELLGTMTMRRVLHALRSRFDGVIVDAPAASPLADVGILTPLVDGVVLIVRAGVTAKPAIHDAVAAIDPAKLVGVVLNDVR
jgi:capsular exopolysaccharide synthesis family protein